MTSKFDYPDEADDAASVQRKEDSLNEASFVGKYVSGVRQVALSSATLLPDFSSTTRVRKMTEEGRYFVMPGPRDTIPDTPEAFLYAEAVQILVQQGQKATREKISAVMDSLREARNSENPGR